METGELKSELIEDVRALRKVIKVEEELEDSVV
jgi:hypothetical protein